MRRRVFDGKEDIFESYRVEVEISKLTQKKILAEVGRLHRPRLYGGPNVIDVNTGKYLGKRGLEDTILKTNLEAVKEIAYQIRLRNVGGIIVVDFIDMERKRLQGDRVSGAPRRIEEGQDKDLCLSYQRAWPRPVHEKEDAGEHGDHAHRILPTCDGSGYIKSRYTISYEVLRQSPRPVWEKARASNSMSTYPRRWRDSSSKRRRAPWSISRPAYGTKINIVANSAFIIDNFEVKSVHVDGTDLMAVRVLRRGQLSKRADHNGMERASSLPPR